MLSFAPDAIDIAPEVLSAVSAVPTERGYRSPPSGVATTVAALAAAPQGGALLTKLDGTTRTIVGTVDKLYEAGATSWTDRSRTNPPSSANGYSIGTARWRFAQFGNTTLAINLATVLQSSASTTFADVANSPKAALMESASGFVMLANTDDSGLSITGGPNAAQQHRWWCSQIFNPTGTWAPSASTQATSGLLVETEGAITGLRRLMNDIVAYKDRSIYVGTYTRDAAVWTWRCLSKDVGCSSQDAIVNVGSVHYFIGDSDIFAFDGTRPIPIGAGVRDWFFARVNRTYLYKIQSLHDRSNSRIYWFYPVGSSDTLTSVLVYHYPSQRWGAFDLTVTDALEAVTGAITYESIGSLYSTYDDLPAIAYDSPAWIANSPVLSYLSSTYVLTNLSGSGSAASMTTGWVGKEGTVSLCTKVRPRYRIKPTTATITPQTVMALGDVPETGAPTAINGDRFDVLQSGRYHRFAYASTGVDDIEALAPTLIAESEE